MTDLPAMTPSAEERAANFDKHWSSDAHNRRSVLRQELQFAYRDGAAAERARILALLASKQAEDVAEAAINNLFQLGLETDDRMAAREAVRATMMLIEKTGC